MSTPGLNTDSLCKLSPLEQGDLPGRTMGSGPQWDTTRYKMRAKSNLLLVQDAKVNGTHLKLGSQEPKSILPSRRHCRQPGVPGRTATTNKQQQRFRKVLGNLQAPTGLCTASSLKALGTDLPQKTRREELWVLPREQAGMRSRNSAFPGVLLMPGIR